MKIITIFIFYLFFNVGILGLFILKGSLKFPPTDLTYLIPWSLGVIYSSIKLCKLKSDSSSINYLIDYFINNEIIYVKGSKYYISDFYKGKFQKRKMKKAINEAIEKGYFAENKNSKEIIVTEKFAKYIQDHLMESIYLISPKASF